MAFIESVLPRFMRETGRTAPFPGFDMNGFSLHYKGEYYPSSNPPSLLRNDRDIKYWVPPLRIGHSTELRAGDRFSSHNEANRASPNPVVGLAEFIMMPFGPYKVPAGFMDNHQHALYFWCQALVAGKIKPGSLLVHFDDHRDGRKPKYSRLNTEKLKDVHDYVMQHSQKDTFVAPAATGQVINEMVWVKARLPADRREQWNIMDGDTPILYGTTIGPDHPLLDRIISGVYSPRELLIADWDTDFSLPFYGEDCNDLAALRGGGTAEEIHARDLRRIRGVMEASGAVTVALSPDHFPLQESLRLINKVFR